MKASLALNVLIRQLVLFLTGKFIPSSIAACQRSAPALHTLQKYLVAASLLIYFC